MNRAERINELLRKAFQQSAEQAGPAGMDERILSDASTSMREAVAAHRKAHRFFQWRRIMSTRAAKLTTAAAVLAAAFVIMTWGGSGSTAWSFEQTIEAIKQLKTLHIKGMTDYWSQPLEFDCWIRCPDGQSRSGAMRFESERVIMVARMRDGMAYFYWPREKLVLITTQGREIEDLKFWYQAAQLSPWLTGKIVETLRLFTDDWKQTVVTDPVTGKEQVHVTCSYRPSNTSIWFVVDTQTKLIERGKMWMNLQQKGEPQFDGRSVVYNQDTPDSLFEFEIPPGATVVTQEEIEKIRVLSQRADEMYHKEKNYPEAMRLYQQVHDKCPRLGLAAEALMMIGFCHNRLGQYDQEIEAYEQIISEYSRVHNFSGVYFYLGRAYMERGQNDKAVEAFENCLTAGGGTTDPNTFPLKDARDYITRLKGQ